MFNLRYGWDLGHLSVFLYIGCVIVKLVVYSIVFVIRKNKSLHPTLYESHFACGISFVRLRPLFKAQKHCMRILLGYKKAYSWINSKLLPETPALRKAET